MIQGTLASFSLPAPPPSHQGPRAELLGGRRGAKDPQLHLVSENPLQARHP